MSKKVLIVDDSPVELANLRTLLADHGYQTITASSGQECVEKAQAEMPNLILLDIIMPLIQNAGPNTNVVFMNDEAGCPLPDLLRQRLPGALVSDVTAPSQLWKLLTDS